MRSSLEGLFVVGGRPQALSNYIFLVNTFAIGGRRTIAKGVFGAQGGHGPVPPAYAPALNISTLICDRCSINNLCHGNPGYNQTQIDSAGK